MTSAEQTQSSAQIHAEDLERLTEQWTSETDRVEITIQESMKRAQDRAYACGYRRGAEAKKQMERERDDLRLEVEELKRNLAISGGAVELHRTRVDELERQNDGLVCKLSDHQRQAALGRAVERASSELPEGFDLHIELEKDAGTVRLYHPDGEEDGTEFHDADHFSGVIDNAINVAIAKGSEA